MLVLKQGSKGKDVLKLQLLLNRYLKPSPKLMVDGDFGAKTKEALIRFQKEKKLTADGIAGKNTWKALGVAPKAATDTPMITVNAPWFDIAKAELGIAEISEKNKHNERIIAYHATTTLGAKTDEVPWCSSFVNWVLNQAGIKGTNNALAKSWATWGVKVNTPYKGIITVIKRKNKNSDSSTGSSTGYHVGFYNSSTPTTINLLGGNQSDKVKYSNFYLKSYDIIAYRKPIQTTIFHPLINDAMRYANYC